MYKTYMFELEKYQVLSNLSQYYSMKIGKKADTKNEKNLVILNRYSHLTFHMKANHTEDFIDFQKNYLIDYVKLRYYTNEYFRMPVIFLMYDLAYNYAYEFKSRWLYEKDILRLIYRDIGFNYDTI